MVIVLKKSENNQNYNSEEDESVAHYTRQTRSILSSPILFVLIAWILIIVRIVIMGESKDRDSFTE